MDPGNRELHEKLKLVEEEGDLILNPHFNPDVMKKLEESQYFSKYYSTIPEFREQFDRLRKNPDLMIPLMKNDSRF